MISKSYYIQTYDIGLDIIAFLFMLYYTASK